MDKKEIIEKVLRPLGKAGFQAYFVGGCVRDSIMGTAPHDFDICTDATPEEIKKVFSHISEMSENSEPYGVTMPVIDGELIEIATMREDITKGRHPQIKFTKDLKKDAERRDFTMNAMYEDADGNIIDPTGGKSDIENGLLRFVGKMEDRCNEDPLRVFRAVRFQSKTGFKPTFDIIKFNDMATELIDNHKFAEVSKERMLKELEGIFGGKHFIECLSGYTPETDDCFEKVTGLFYPSLISEVMGFESIFKEMEDTEQSFKWHAEGALIRLRSGEPRIVRCDEDLKEFKELVHHGNVMDHTTRVVVNMLNELDKTEFDIHKRFLMVMAAFLHDCGKPIAAKKLGVKHSEFKVNGIDIVEDVPKVVSHDIEGEKPAFEFCKSLGMSNADCSFVSGLVKRHMRAHQIGDMKNKARLWKFVQKEFFQELVVLARADERACIKTVDDNWNGIDNVLARPEIKALVETPLPKALVDGNALIAAGLAPSPSFKKMIDIAFEQQINKGISDVNALVKMVKGVK